jgi:hypothetical protein
MARTRRSAKPRASRTSRPAASFARLGSTALGAVDPLLRRVSALRSKGRTLAIATAGDAIARTAGAISRLEHVFEARVSQVVAKLGVPKASDVRALARQVARLQESVDQLRRGRARA